MQFQHTLEAQVATANMARRATQCRKTVLEKPRKESVAEEATAISKLFKCQRRAGPRANTGSPRIFANMTSRTTVLLTALLYRKSNVASKISTNGMNKLWSTIENETNTVLICFDGLTQSYK